MLQGCVRKWHIGLRAWVGAACQYALFKQGIGSMRNAPLFASVLRSAIRRLGVYVLMCTVSTVVSVSS